MIKFNYTQKRQPGHYPVAVFIKDILNTFTLCCLAGDALRSQPPVENVEDTGYNQRHYQRADEGYRCMQVEPQP